MKMSRLLLFVVCLIGGLQTLPSYAVEPSEILPDPVLEARARGLSAELRCMVCQNESIDESNAPLAHDLRVLVREHLKAGESDAAIRQYLVARYGDFILLKPPFKTETFFLWGAPLLVLLAGGLGIAFAARRRSAQPTVLNAEEQARLADLLKE